MIRSLARLTAAALIIASAAVFAMGVRLEFRAEAARMQADLAPTTGEDVQKLVARIYATPRPVVERVKKLLAP